LGIKYTEHKGYSIEIELYPQSMTIKALDKDGKTIATADTLQGITNSIDRYIREQNRDTKYFPIHVFIKTFNTLVPGKITSMNGEKNTFNQTWIDPTDGSPRHSESSTSTYYHLGRNEGSLAYFPTPEVGKLAEQLTEISTAIKALQLQQNAIQKLLPPVLTIDDVKQYINQIKEKGKTEEKK